MEERKKSNYTLPQANNLDNVEINFVDMSNAVQSEIYVGNLMDISMTNPDFFALKLGNQILGGSSTARLFMNLREDKGFTYGSYSSASLVDIKVHLLLLQVLEMR